jgi:hypothetical protein
MLPKFYPYQRSRLLIVDFGPWELGQILIFGNLIVLRPFKNAVKVLALVPGVGVGNRRRISFDPMMQLNTGIRITHQNLSEHFNAMV